MLKLTQDELDNIGEFCPSVFKHLSNVKQRKVRQINETDPYWSALDHFNFMYIIVKDSIIYYEGYPLDREQQIDKIMMTTARPKYTNMRKVKRIQNYNGKPDYIWYVVEDSIKHLIKCEIDVKKDSWIIRPVLGHVPLVIPSSGCLSTADGFNEFQIAGLQNNQ